VVVVDKPSGWTSHDVVGRCRRIFGQRRVGHAGTLDPSATGILVVGLGRATRLLRFLTELPKSYTGQIVLGVATTTLDADGEVTGRWDLSGVDEADVHRAAARLTGPIEQVPPMVSAVKVAGRRLHELARAGIEVDRAPRPVTVHRFELRPGAEPGVWEAEVTCSSGTYVRVLAADLGGALGGGAHLRGLRRTAAGSFTLADARTLEDVAVAPAEAVLSPARAMSAYPGVAVGDELAAAVRHGRPLGAARLGVDDVAGGPWAVHDAAGQLLAVYEFRALYDPAPGDRPPGEGLDGDDGPRLYPAVVLDVGPG